MKITKKDKRTQLEKEIDDVLSGMKCLAKNSKEYEVTIGHLETLYKAKSTEKCNRVSRDTMAIIAGNLMGILLILHYEKLDVITSRAVGFIIKGRV